MDKTREELINLINIKGISSEEVIKVSMKLDNLIVRYYKQTLAKKIIQQSVAEGDVD